MNMTIQFWKNGQSMSMQVMSTELFAVVALRYMEKLGLTNDASLKFFYNNEQISLEAGKTINELKMFNGSIVQVTSGNQQPQMMNFQPPQNFQNFQNFNQFQQGAGNSNFININFVLNGKKVMVQGQSSDKFCDLATKFSNKAALANDDFPRFIFNSTQISASETKTLNELKLQNQSRIEVFLEKEVIGA